MTVDPQLFRRADALLDQALDLDDLDDRRAFVEAEASGEPELAELVLRLLGYAAGDPSRLRPGGAVDTTLGHEVDAALTGLATPSGELVGRYRIVRELGRGGMAVVFLAERVDGDFRQQVALKLIQDRFPGPSAVARFERERQILADARHPNVARLLDGGATEDGRPFLVMEHVDGEPIDAWCDRRRLSIRHRLRLFIQVARAVEHAHRNLVVHRDIKPTNILVTDDANVKLLDFGIARLMDDAADGAELTATFDRPMTPAYASPEQVRGEAVTTASDVYQLGVLLYLLLTGRWPYRTGQTSGARALVAICEEPATRPSSVVTERRRGAEEQPTSKVENTDAEAVAEQRSTTPRGLRHELAGDLDAIVMTMLRKEPDRRYGSVTRLIGDLEAYLDHRPVSARGDSLGYRAARFVRRHAAAATVGAAGLTAIIAFGAFHLVEVGRERDRARAEAAAATETAAFLRSLFEVASPTRSQGEEISARELLERGAARVESELADQPDVQAEMMTVIGGVQRDLGLYEASRDILARAVDLRRDVPGDGSLQLAESLYELGRTCEKLQDADTGLAALDEAKTLRTLALGSDHPDVARTDDALGVILTHEGELERARTLQESAIATLEATVGPDDVELAHALNHYATTLQAMREYRASLDQFERARDIFEIHLGRNHPLTAGVTHNMAYSARFAGEPERAEALYRESLERIEAVYGADHPNVGVVLNNFANLMKDQGRLDEAEELHQRTYELWKAALGPDHPRITWSLNNLGLIERERGDHNAARQYFEETIAVLERTLPPDHHELGTPLNNLARELIDLGEPAAALPLLERSFAIRERVYGPGHSFLSSPIYLRGRAELALGRAVAAEASFAEAAELGRSDGDVRSHEVTAARIGLAKAIAAQGRLEHARAVLLDELDVAEAEERADIEAAIRQLGG
jgi:serine/threonine-protein kinase